MGRQGDLPARRHPMSDSEGSALSEWLEGDDDWDDEDDWDDD